MGLGHNGIVPDNWHAISHSARVQQFRQGNLSVRETGSPAPDSDPSKEGHLPIVAAVIDRMQQVVGVGSDIELAEKLGVGRSTPGNWRSRDKFPLDECLGLAIRHSVSLDWLLFGDGGSVRGVLDVQGRHASDDPSVPKGHIALDRLKGFDVTPGPERLIFPEAVVTQRLSDDDIAAGAIRWMVNPDTAMDPTYPRGAILLVDSTVTSRDAIEDGHTYVIRLATRLLVRRIFILGAAGNNEYRLAGYRPKEGRRDLTGPDYLQLEIGGKVVDVI